MKKLLSILVAVMMIMTLAIPAFAAGEGSITINGISDGNTYEIYKLLDLESYDPVSGAYSYKVNSDWAGFFASSVALRYVAIDDAGYVTWTAAEDDSTVAAFAKAAMAYAETQGLTPVKSSTVSGDFIISGSDSSIGKFSDLELGYYLIDSTMGALCGLTTTNPDASINAKNGSPTLEKHVQEDALATTPGTDGGWGTSSTADIGQTVYYRVTVSVHAGAQNYILHDVMADGITFGRVTKVNHIVPGTGEHTASDSLYTVKTGADVSTDGCTFEIHFSEELCNELETNDKLVIYYEATLNENAVIAGAGNENKAWLSYGEGHTTAVSSVITYTYSIDVVKTDSQNKLIDGATFRIYDALTGGNEIAVVWDATNNAYRSAMDGETGVDIVVANGKVKVIGLDNGTYYIEEKAAPQGYNKLTARQRFIISDGNLDAIFNGEVFSTGSGVHVVNKTGSMLPETGGMGTTIFVTLGGLMVLAAGVVLFAKKRMSQIGE